MRGGWCRGLLLEEKPELKRVLEQRRLELHREEEMAQRRPSDLETELRKRQQKLEEVRAEMTAANKDVAIYCLLVFRSAWTVTVLLKFVISFFFLKYEQQEIRQRENQQKIPEFVRVKDNLRRTQTPEQ